MQSPHDRHIIMQAKRTLLFSEGEPWTKKDVSGDMFDVTMGWYDGAEKSKLMLSQLKTIPNEELALYFTLHLLIPLYIYKYIYIYM